MLAHAEPIATPHEEEGNEEAVGHGAQAHESLLCNHTAKVHKSGGLAKWDACCCCQLLFFSREMLGISWRCSTFGGFLKNENGVKCRIKRR